MRQAQQDAIHAAIERSQSHSQIVTISVDDLDEALAGIAAHPDARDYDYVDTTDQDGEPLREVWDASHDDDSMDWRVHLILRAAGQSS